MSTSKVIPKDKAVNIERWQCPNVEDSGNGNDPTSVSLGPITAEAIENIQKQAYKEAYDEGFAKGHKDGSAKAESEFDVRIDALNRALSVLAAPFEQLDKEVEEQITQLAISIARQLVRREIKTDPGQIIPIVREAVLALPSASKRVYVYLNPDDLEFVKAKVSGSETESYWKLLEDPTLNRGDCKVMTDVSTIDATVERRLSSIVAGILGGEREQDLSA